MCRSKLSSVCWNSYVKSNLICSDYEGVVQLWDVSQQTETMAFEEHAKRVWSVDFSHVSPYLSCLPFLVNQKPYVDSNLCNSQERLKVQAASYVWCLSMRGFVCTHCEGLFFISY